MIDILDLYASIDDLAKFGAFQAINMVDDWLPIDYDRSPNVFVESERSEIAEFFRLFEIASNSTNRDTWDVNWFKSSDEWMHLSAAAKNALLVLLERGHFSEDKEEPSLI